MSNQDIHVGDTGTNIDVDLVDENGSEVIVNTGDAIQFKFRKPDGTIITKAGTIVSPPSSKVRYTTSTNDLDQVGRWQAQVKADIAASGWIGHTCKFSFDVLPTFV